MDQGASSATQRAEDDMRAPVDVDITKASIARVYDYVLGGKEHFEVDRRAAGAFLGVVPEAAQIAKDNRNLLRRGVRYLVGEGIRQIIDIGSGLPSSGNVHEVAQQIDPTVRVVYVDKDPIVLAHGRALLSDDRTTTVITADLRTPESIFDHPSTAEYIDLAAPFAVLTSGILHHLSDADDPYRVTATITERLSPGSYLLASNFLDDDEPRAKELERAFLEGGLGHGRFRTWTELRRFFDGLELVEPGLVYANDWRPDEHTPTDSPVHTLYAGGIGRKAG
ncbi:SAM-dependent methyltransferase [Pseudonocardia nigra]|uniref:SAM-dependent methyltransferase n=1 Tax=Pseudonocardia nigra TaxID=1921578 RepID=UPI0027E24CCD|nr:SAM-dependent methyltransferase [Pseudonocardia nigra]